MIKCICINDNDKPKEIPQEKWIKKGNNYHIIWILKMVNQNNIQGVQLAEISLDNYLPYEAFKMSRFAINSKDLEKLIKLMQDCTDFNKELIIDLVKNIELIEN